MSRWGIGALLGYKLIRSRLVTKMIKIVLLNVCLLLSGPHLQVPLMSIVVFETWWWCLTDGGRIPFKLFARILGGRMSKVMRRWWYMGSSMKWTCLYGLLGASYWNWNRWLWSRFVVSHLWYGAGLWSYLVQFEALPGLWSYLVQFGALPRWLSIFVLLNALTSVFVSSLDAVSFRRGKKGKEKD